MLEINLYWWDYLSLFLIFFVGIPHGALDGAISITLGYSKKISLQIRFLISYIFFSSVILIFWYYFPVISLISFILISIFHFGCGDLKWNTDNFYYIRGYVHGSLIVLGIIFLNLNEVEQFFEILSGNNLSLLWISLKAMLLFCCLSIIFLLINYKRINFSIDYLKLMFPIILIISFSPPLLAFALYFCFIHSFNHMKRIIPTLFNFMNKAKAIWLMAIFSLLSWLGGALALYHLSFNFNQNEALIKVIFIGLAALTFPHMVLVDGFFRQKFKI